MVCARELAKTSCATDKEEIKNLGREGRGKSNSVSIRQARNHSAGGYDILLWYLR